MKYIPLLNYVVVDSTFGVMKTHPTPILVLNLELRGCVPRSCLHETL